VKPERAFNLSARVIPWEVKYIFKEVNMNIDIKDGGKSSCYLALFIKESDPKCEQDVINLFSFLGIRIEKIE